MRKDTSSSVNIPADTLRDIIKIARIHELDEVVLYGSRARGENDKFSDVDLAIRGGSAIDFRQDLDDFAAGYLFFDAVNLDQTKSEELKNEINRDGIIIYEKV